VARRICADPGTTDDGDDQVAKGVKTPLRRRCISI
jgi:hypothetical protein